VNRRSALRWSLLTVAAGLGLALLSVLWLVRSDGGRDWLLARLVGVLPAGATLSWQQIDGSLAGPLQIRGLHYDYQGTRFDAQRLRVDHGFWPLLSGRLDIHTLTLEHAVLVLAPAKPLELPRWPEVLPALDWPITVAVAKLQVRDLRVRQDGRELAHIARIDGGLTVGHGGLQLRDLRLASNRSDLRLAGDYLPRDNFRTALSGRLDFPAVAGAPPATATLSAKGDLDDFLLAVDGQAPTPLIVRLHLLDGRNRPHWRLDAKSAHLLLAQLGLGDDPAPYALDLHLLGAGGEATLHGSLARGELSAVIAPSRLRVAQGVVSLAPLALDLGQGPLTVVGALVLRGGDPAFDLRLRSQGLQWSPQAGAEPQLPVRASGQLRLHGRWQAWVVDGTATLLRNRQRATVQLAGKGDARHLVLDQLLARTPTGTLRGRGELHWDPRLKLSLASELSGFDPGYFLPDYPGAVSGQISGQAERGADGAWRGEATVAGLRGSLRKRPLRGEAALHFAGDQGSGTLRLDLGNSHVSAGGSYGAAIDLQALFSPLDLADLWPAAAGRLQGQVAVRGTRAAPAYSADLHGQGLRWGELAAAELSARGALPARGRGGDLRLSATGFAYAGQRFDRARLDLSGSVADFRARAALAGGFGRLDGEFSAAGQGPRWQGRLAQLQIAPARGAAWRLQSAAGYRYADGRFQLERACLRPVTGAGELCAQGTGTQASLRGRGLPLILVEPWLPENTLALQPFGSVDLDGDFVRAAGAGWGGNLQLRSASGGLRVDPQLPRELFGYRDLRLDLQLRQSRLTAVLAAQLAAGGSISGRLQAGLAAHAPLQGQLQLDLRQLDWLELLSADLAGPTGQLTGTLNFAGQLAAPVLSGDARLSRFAAELPALGVKLHDGEFALHGGADGQARITGQVTSGKGRLRVDGSLNLRDRQAPLQLGLHGEDITVADTPDLDATMSPDLDLRYADGTLQIRGSVRVPSARVDLERLDQSVSPSADVVVLDPRPSARRSAFLIDTDVQVQLGDAVRLRGFGLDGTLGGSLRIRDRPGRAAQATGTLDVAGKYSAYGRALDIKRGRLSYVNAAYDNPALDIVAEHEFDQVTVGVRVRGSALAPQTTVTSSPAMATAEALSWLLIGRPLSSASGSETARISASALALSAGSNLLAQQIGSRLGLDSAGISDSRALGGSVLTVGKQVSPRLFVSYGLSLLGTGQVLTLKYLLAHGLNVSLESGTVETAGSLNWRKEK
jgi:translocation and assembly module TamB